MPSESSDDTDAAFGRPALNDVRGTPYLRSHIWISNASLPPRSVLAVLEIVDARRTREEVNGIMDIPGELKEGRLIGVPRVLMPTANADDDA